MAAIAALGQLSSLLTRLPVLDESSPEVGLVAGELNSWAPVSAREKILLLMAQVGGAAAVRVGARLEGWAQEGSCAQARCFQPTPPLPGTGRSAVGSPKPHQPRRARPAADRRGPRAADGAAAGPQT